jgi:ankyrin repeat protein
VGGQFRQANWLLKHGADPNRRAEGNGWTAVHQAASRGNVNMLKAVLAAGGDASARDAEGLTPRDVARNTATAKPEVLALLPRGRGA